MNDKPELRQNIVSKEWILVAPGRRRRPGQFSSTGKDKPTPVTKCPFEDPQKTNEVDPLIWYSRKGAEHRFIQKRDWLLQVIPNRYPAVEAHRGKTCPVPRSMGIYRSMQGVGLHEIVIPRSHTKFLADMTDREAELIIRAYQDRILYHRDEQCLAYIFIFHNHGSRAGASVWHPHSQILALPIIPPDIQRSLSGSKLYMLEHKKCAHCEVIRHELKTGERIIYKNKHFIVIAPFASQVNFEIRIFPILHRGRFEDISSEERLLLASALVTVLRKLKKGLKNPAYNFFIHTAPILEDREYDYYHWHLEIFPKTSHLASVEHGTGVEILTVVPEEAAAYLRKI